MCAHAIAGALGSKTMGRPKVKIVNLCHRYSCHRHSHSSIYGSSIVNPKAFTLIELLVVIAIIALLMAILVPVLRSARNQARAVVCQVNLKQWGSVFFLYTEDNQGQFPERIGDAFWFLRGSFLHEDDPNKPRVYQNINAKGIACYPMAVRSREPAPISTFEFPPYYVMLYKPGSTFKAWEIISPLPRFRCSYGFNIWLFDSSVFDTSAPKIRYRHLRPLNIYPI